MFKRHSVQSYEAAIDFTSPLDGKKREVTGCQANLKKWCLCYYKGKNFFSVFKISLWIWEVWKRIEDPIDKRLLVLFRFSNPLTFCCCCCEKHHAVVRSGWVWISLSVFLSTILLPRNKNRCGYIPSLETTTNNKQAETLFIFDVLLMKVLKAM